MPGLGTEQHGSVRGKNICFMRRGVLENASALSAVPRREDESTG